MVSIDFVQRYLPVLDFIEERKIKNILEVGGGSLGFSYFTDRAITGCDLSFEGESKKTLRKVVSSTLDLPFKNNEFDAVISMDMLEHIPPKDRKKAVMEMLRVSKKFLVLSAPCGKKIGRYELIAAKFLKNNRWLKEHAKHELPSEETIIRTINGNHDIKILKNSNLQIWLLNIILEKIPGYARITGFILKPFMRLMNFGETYRKIFIVEKK